MKSMVFMVGLRGGFGWGCVRALMFFEAGEVGCFIIFGAVFPAGVENANPFKGQRSDRGVVALSGFGFGFDEVAGPLALENRAFGKLNPRLVQELWLGQAAADDTAIATLHTPRRHAAADRKSFCREAI